MQIADMEAVNARVSKEAESLRGRMAGEIPLYLAVARASRTCIVLDGALCNGMSR